MLDLEKLRAENKARLLGLKEEPESMVEKITKESLSDNPEAAWHIIALVVKPKTVKVGDKTRTLKERAYPQLAEEVTVGSFLAKSSARKKVSTRTNIETMTEMYRTRNRINKFAISEEEDKYAAFFTSIVETLDVYAVTVACDLLDANPALLDEVYEIDVAEKQAQAQRLEDARQKRASKS